MTSEDAAAKTATKQKILDVAETLFLEIGYEKTSIRKITDKAGVNVASINYHFGSKEVLVVEIIKRVFDNKEAARIPVLKQLLEEIENGKKVELSEVIEAAIKPFFDYSEEHGDRARQMMIFLHRIFVNNEINIPRQHPHQLPESVLLLHQLIARITGKTMGDFRFILPLIIMGITNTTLVALTDEKRKSSFPVGFPPPPPLAIVRRQIANFIAGGILQMLEQEDS